MKPKGQTAVEYLVTTSFLLIITGIIFAYALFIYTDSTVTSTARSAVSTIVNTIDQVRALGPENVLYTEAEIPPNVFSVSYQDNPDSNVTQLILKLQTAGGLSDIVKTAKGTFTLDAVAQCMLAKQGRYKIKVYSVGCQAPMCVSVCVDNGSGSCQTSC